MTTDGTEYDECDATQSGTRGLERRGVFPALCAHQSFSIFLPALVRFDKRGARAEDGRKRQEQSAGRGAPKYPR